MHFIVFPRSCVSSSFFIKECSISLSQISLLLPLVSSPSIVLIHIFKICLADKGLGHLFVLRSDLLFFLAQRVLNWRIFYFSGDIIRARVIEIFGFFHIYFMNIFPQHFQQLRIREKILIIFSAWVIRLDILQLLFWFLLVGVLLFARLVQIIWKNPITSIC